MAILLIGHLDMEARKKACQGSLARLGAYDRNISSFPGKADYEHFSTCPRRSVVVGLMRLALQSLSTVVLYLRAIS